MREAESPPSGRVPGHDERNSWSVATRLSAVTLRPNEATVLYNAACVFCSMNKKSEALDAIRKTWEAGFKDPEWARRDPTSSACTVILNSSDSILKKLRSRRSQPQQHRNALSTPYIG